MAVLAALAFAVGALPTVSLIAPVSDTGAWRIYTGSYWQTHEGRRMNQPRSEVVTGGKQPASMTLEGGYQVKRVAPIVNPSPIVGGAYAWGRFEGVDGLRIIGATFRFTRANANEGCGVNFRFSKNIRIENCTFYLEGGGDPTVGGSGYGAVFSGCENITLVNCDFVQCHAGVMFTDGTINAAIFDSRSVRGWMGVSSHGGNVQKLLICRFTGDRIHIGNVTLPDGAGNVSIIDSVAPVLEFSGKVTNAKVQGGSFREIILNQYKARPGDSQSDYSQSNIEIDGTTKVGKFLVKSL